VDNGAGLDGRVVVGWLLLDMRFQIDLWRQLARTAAMFAGKTPTARSTPGPGRFGAVTFSLQVMPARTNPRIPAKRSAGPGT